MLAHLEREQTVENLIAGFGCSQAPVTVQLRRPSRGYGHIEAGHSRKEAVEATSILSYDLPSGREEIA